MKKFQAIFTDPATGEFRAKAFVHARTDAEAHDKINALVRATYPGVEPSNLDGLIYVVLPATSFREPSAP